MRFEGSLDQIRLLERELDIIGKSVVDEGILSRKRQQLQLAYGHCILSYPSESHAENIDATLWRHCFYLPIDYYRRQLKDPKSAKGRWALSELSRLIDSGLAFLATLLYDLCSLYASPENSCQVRIGAIFDAIGLPVPGVDAHGSKVTFECMQSILYRVLIFCGDLARYRCQFNKAFQADNFEYAWQIYSAARHLAPDQGHACNQLAVVCSLLHDMPLTVYWYLRAECCAAPFAAARRNVASYLDKALVDNQSLTVEPWHPFFVFILNVVNGSGSLETLSLETWLDEHFETLLDGQIFLVLCILCSCAMICPGTFIEAVIKSCISISLSKLELIQISSNKDYFLFLLILGEIVLKQSNQSAHAQFTEFLVRWGNVEFPRTVLQSALDLEGYSVFYEMLPKLKNSLATGEDVYTVAMLTRSLFSNDGQDIISARGTETVGGSLPHSHASASESLFPTQTPPPHSNPESPSDEIVVFKGFLRAIND